MIRALVVSVRIYGCGDVGCAVCAEAQSRRIRIRQSTASDSGYCGQAEGQEGVDERQHGRCDGDDFGCRDRATEADTDAFQNFEPATGCAFGRERETNRGCEEWRR